MWSDALHSVGSWRDYLNTNSGDEIEEVWYDYDYVERSVGYNKFSDEAF